MTDARRLVDKLWSYCNVLRDHGVSTIERSRGSRAHDGLRDRLTSRSGGVHVKISP